MKETEHGLHSSYKVRAIFPFFHQYKHYLFEVLFLTEFTFTENLRLRIWAKVGREKSPNSIIIKSGSGTVEYSLNQTC